MEKYIVSALKYRPSNFKSVVGQKNLTSTLQNAIRSNRLAHAYLFCGPRGTGKTTCARIFAKSINCLQPTSDLDACNQCESCKAFNEQRSFNIHELDAASNNSVEDIRNLIDQVRIPPQIGKYSVYIIDEVHMLSKDAFNALLKTLEEPPSYAIFILATTEKHKVIPTILSRCQIYDFSRIMVSDIIHHLQRVAKDEDVNITEEALNVVAQKADGGMRDALSIFDQLVAFCDKDRQISYEQAISVLNVLDTEYYFQILDYSAKNDVSSSLLILNEILNKGFDAIHFISGLASHIRNLLVSKDPKTTELLETSDSIRKHYQDQAKQFTSTYLFAALNIMTETEINYRQACNKRLTLEIMLIKLCQISASKVNLSTSVARLQKQESTIQPKFTSTTTPVSNSPSTQATHMQTRQPTLMTKPTIPRIPAIPMEQKMPTFPSVPNITTADAKTKGESQSSLQAQNAITMTSLEEAWRTLGQNFQGNAHIISVLTSAQLSYTGNVISIQVASPMQENIMNEYRSIIHGHLEKSIGNNDIQIVISVPSAPSGQALTKEERFTKLKLQNSALAALDDAMGLTLE